MTSNILIDCGQRLGKLSLKQFSEATKKHGLGSCFDAAPIQAGNFKQNVLLKRTGESGYFEVTLTTLGNFPKNAFLPT